MEIFKLTNLGRVIIKVEAYRAQGRLTQCYNCQKFGHVWVNCRQSPRCMWCGGGHLDNKECPKKAKEHSTPQILQMHAGRWGKIPSLKLSRLQPCERRTAPQKGTNSLHGEDSNWGSRLLQVHNTSTFLRGSSPGDPQPQSQ